MLQLRQEISGISNGSQGCCDTGAAPGQRVARGALTNGGSAPPRRSPSRCCPVPPLSPLSPGVVRPPGLEARLGWIRAGRRLCLGFPSHCWGAVERWKLFHRVGMPQVSELGETFHPAPLFQVGSCTSPAAAPLQGASGELRNGTASTGAAKGHNASCKYLGDKHPGRGRTAETKRWHWQSPGSTTAERRLRH